VFNSLPFRVECCVALNLVGVALCLAAVKDRRVEFVEDVAKDSWVFANSGHEYEYALTEVCIGLEEGGSEE
jgi:hypothetical protein